MVNCPVTLSYCPNCEGTKFPKTRKRITVPVLLCFALMQMCILVRFMREFHGEAEEVCPGLESQPLYALILTKEDGF